MVKEKLELNYIGTDDWDRPVYESTDGKLFKDTNLGEFPTLLCTTSSFDGEPCSPLNHTVYKDKEIVFLSKKEVSVNKFEYMMLSRLQSDCEYFLGNGNRNEKSLWADSTVEHIQEMKRLWNVFPENAKPEWLTYEQIEEYESKLIAK